MDTKSYDAICNAIRWHYYKEEAGGWDDYRQGLDDAIRTELEACVPNEVERLKAEGIVQYKAEDAANDARREAYCKEHPETAFKAPSYVG